MAECKRKEGCLKRNSFLIIFCAEFINKGYTRIHTYASSVNNITSNTVIQSKFKKGVKKRKKNAKLCCRQKNSYNFKKIAWKLREKKKSNSYIEKQRIINIQLLKIRCRFLFPVLYNNHLRQYVSNFTILRCVPSTPYITQPWCFKPKQMPGKKITVLDMLKISSNGIYVWRTFSFLMLNNYPFSF